jgi:hypothetical protein
VNPLTNSPYAPNDNLTTRGAIWSFLRYAADRRGGTESEMWLQLANPTTASHGFANLVRVIGPDLVAWVRDWATANYADDFIPGIRREDSHPSWNYRSIISNLTAADFPLATQSLDSVAITSVGIGDGSSAFLRFGVPGGTVGGARVTVRGGLPPAGFFLSVLRTR